jgi:hypothetical protein
MSDDRPFSNFVVATHCKSMRKNRQNQSLDTFSTPDHGPPSVTSLTPELLPKTALQPLLPVYQQRLATAPGRISSPKQIEIVKCPLWGQALISSFAVFSERNNGKAQENKIFEAFSRRRCDPRGRKK